MYDRNRYLENKEKHKKYYQENKDLISIRSKKYYAKNKTKILKYNREYAKKNPDVKLNIMKKHFKKYGKILNMTSTGYNSALIGWSNTVKKRDKTCKICNNVDLPLPLIPIMAIDSFFSNSMFTSEKSSYSNVCDKFFADSKFIKRL